jgi:hypothetical protein
VILTPSLYFLRRLRPQVGTHTHILEAEELLLNDNQ